MGELRRSFTCGLYGWQWCGHAWKSDFLRGQDRRREGWRQEEVSSLFLMHWRFFFVFTSCSLPGFISPVVEGGCICGYTERIWLVRFTGLSSLSVPNKVCP